MQEKSRKIKAHCVILAAGMGTRMKSTKSKVLHEISGKPMVEIVLELARKIHAEITVVVSHENISQVKPLLMAGENAVVQEERLGTGHAVMQAVGKLEKSDAQKVVILYADTPLITELTLQNMLHRNDDVTFLGFEELDISNKYGRLVTEKDTLLEIIEYKDAAPQQRNITTCNSGVVCVEKNFLIKALTKLEPSKTTREYYLTDIAKIGNNHGKKCGFILCEKSEVIGVNSRNDLAVVDAIMQERIKNFHMQNGVTFLLPQTSYVCLDVSMGKDITIEPNCFIGKNVKIEDDVTIHAMSHLEDCTVHSGVSVGPFARIRPKTVLHSGVRIGNFVEVKNSQIGENSKANHLAYVGDSTIGENCNIGAGTIFCNYDGFNKFRSTVGNEVFIGSNSTIVSPVELSKGTIVGAGSVVTQSTTENSLVIARAPQVEIPSGGERFRKKRKK